MFASLAADFSVAAFLPLFDLILKITALIVLAAVAAVFARRAAAATRHLLYLCALIASLALPVVGWLIPPTVGARWQVPVRQSTSQLVAPPMTTDVAPNPPVTTGPASPAPPEQSAAALPATNPTASDITTREHAFPTISLISLLWTVYALGAAFVLSQVFLGALAVRRLARSSSPADPRRAGAGALTAALAEVGGIGERTVRLHLTPDATPMTWGWRHPTILLPADAEAWEPERLHVVLLHELAHIARRDWPIQMLVHAICAVYWFHPLVWWAASRLRAESERACDDRVLLAGVPSDTYAAYLLDIAQSIKAPRGGSGSTSTTRFASSMARSGGLKERLMAIIAPSTTRRRLRKRYVVATLVLSALCLLPVSLLHLTTRRAEAEGAEAKATEPKPDMSLAFYRVPEDKRWVRDAGDGATVELVGLTKHVTEESFLSWNPVGIRFSKPFYTDSPGLNPDASGFPPRVEFGLRVHPASDKTVALQSTHVTDAFGQEFGSTSPPTGFSLADYAKTYAKTGGLFPINIFFQSKARTANLRLDVAAGPWETEEAATLDLDKKRKEKVVFDENGILQFGAPSLSPGGWVTFSAPLHKTSALHHPLYGFVITDNLHRVDSDIEAVDETGAIRRPDENDKLGVYSENMFHQKTVWFDETHLPFNQLKQLRFKMRPYRTVEFRNVSLYPK